MDEQVIVWNVSAECVVRLDGFQRDWQSGHRDKEVVADVMCVCLHLHPGAIID